MKESSAKEEVDIQHPVDLDLEYVLGSMPQKVSPKKDMLKHISCHKIINKDSIFEIFRENIFK